MRDLTPEEIVHRYIDAQSRGYAESSNLMQEIDYFVDPDASDLSGSPAVADMYNREILLDTTAEDFLHEYADYIASNLLPAGTRWFNLQNTARVRPEELFRSNRYLNIISHIAYQEIQRTNFTGAFQMGCWDAVKYGVAAIATEVIGGEVYFRSLPMKKLVIKEDIKGNVSEVGFEKKYTSTQMRQMITDGKCGSKEIAKVLEEFLDSEDERLKMIIKEEVKEYTVTVLCYYMPKGGNINSEKYVKETIIKDKKIRIKKPEEYDYKPITIFRYRRSNKHPYGVGEGKRLLSKARIINATKAKVGRAVDFHLDPIIGIPSESDIEVEQGLNPGDIIIKDPLSNSSIEAISPGGNFPIGEEFIEREVQSMAMITKRDVINMDKKERQTTAEIYELASIRNKQLAPAMVWMISEGLLPLLEGFIKILKNLNKFPEYRGEGNILAEINLNNPLLSDIKLERLQSLARGIQLVSPYLNIEPEARQKINVEKLIEHVYTDLGTGAFIRTDDELDEYRMELAEEQQRIAEQQNAGQPQSSAEQGKMEAETAKLEAETENILKGG